MIVSREHRAAVGCALLSLLIIGFFFQNCSKVAVEDLSSKVDQSSVGVTSGTSKITVGTENLADLKMLFVIDNSYTMKKNNINLGDSFQTLFNSQNAENLNPFKVSSYLLTIGQRTPFGTADDMTRLNQLAAWQINSSQLSPSSLSSYRSPSSLGKVPGDSVGYAISSNSSSITFQAAPVLGISADGTVTGEILKSKSSSPDQMVQDFKNRISMLQNVPLENYEANQDILDRESGLCAIARTLRSPDKFFKAGDVPVLNVFTDEDDADADGKNCIASFTIADGKENLIDGACETRSTSLKYNYNRCDINYQDSFSWKLNFKKSVPNSSITYYPTNGYSCPQTELNFQSVTAWQKKQTVINITYQTFTTVDGTRVTDPTLKTKSVQVVGYKSESECTTLAKNNLNIITEQYVSNTCTQTAVSVASCSGMDSNCIPVSQVPKTITVAGDYSSSTSCSSAVQNADPNFNPSSVSCRLLDTTAISSSNNPGCSLRIAATPVTVANISSDLSTQAACDSEARSRGGYVSSQYPATCATQSKEVTDYRTGSFRFADFPGTVAGTCPQAVQDKAALNFSIASANVVSCSVDPVSTKTSSQTLRQSDCSQEAQQFCSNHPEYINCRLKDAVPAGGVQASGSLSASEELSCQSKCQDSKLNFCKTTASLPSVDPQMLVSDYLAKAYQGRDCSASVSVSSTVSKFQAKLESQKASICVPKTSAGIPVYTKVTQTYMLKGLVPDFVAGNSSVNGQIQPATDLPTYIFQRSKELFGDQKPILNVFIRTANDPLGDSGSRGAAYERLAVMMGGQVNSVLSTDYSPALKDLAGLIKSKMMRSFKVPQMNETQKVTSVTLTSQGHSQALDPSQWSQSGQTVLIKEQVALELGDELQISFEGP